MRKLNYTRQLSAKVKIFDYYFISKKCHTDSVLYESYSIARLLFAFRSYHLFLHGLRFAINNYGYYYFFC